MTKYVKYVRDDIAYYIGKAVVPQVCLSGDFEDVTDLYLLQFSDYACNQARNELIKCRMPVAEALEAGIGPIEPVRDRAQAETIAQSVENLRNELLANGNLSLDNQAILMKLNSCLYREYPHKEHQ